VAARKVEILEGLRISRILFVRDKLINYYNTRIFEGGTDGESIPVPWSNIFKGKIWQ